MSPGALLGVVLAGLLAATAPQSDGPGSVVVVEVRPGLAAARAGLRAGDRVIAWEQAGAEGHLTSPFDLLDVELERAPRGPVTLRGSRGGQALTASLFPDEWGVEVRPELLPDQLEAYEAAHRSLRAGDRETALRGLRSLAESLGAGPRVEPALWARLEWAEAQVAEDPAEALATVDEAARRARAHVPGSALEAHLYASLGEALAARGHTAHALKAFTAALALREARHADGLATAATLQRLGELAYEHGEDFETARERLTRAQAVVEAAAPRSLLLVRTLRACAQVGDGSAGDAHRTLRRASALAEELAPESLTLAATLHAEAWVTAPPLQADVARRALEMQERLAPDSAAVAASLSFLALNLVDDGRIEQAEAYLRRALALRERLTRGTQAHASSLRELANFFKEQGDLAEAERLLRDALAIQENVAPRAFRTAILLLDLAELLRLRRELVEAATVAARALAISEQVAPQSELVAFSLRDLGTLSRERGDHSAAESFFLRSIHIFKNADFEFARGTAENELALTLVETGRHAEAQAAYERALEATTANPHDWHRAEVHHNAGNLALKRRDLDAAQTHHEAALEIRRRHSPDSLFEALSTHALGLVALARGRDDEALALFRRAAEAVEAQGRRLGGSAEARAAFRAHYQSIYRDLEELLLKQGRSAEAFHVVERSRARDLLALMSGRDLAPGPAIPPDLERERRRADAVYDRLLQRLGLEAAGLAPDALEDLRRRLAEARRSQDEVRARIRAAAPRQTALRDPEPLDLAGVQAILDPGTLLLSYRLGAAASRVYAVGPASHEFAVVPLPASEEGLRADVVKLRERLQSGRGTRGIKALRAESQALTDRLLAPLADSIRRAERILVLPEGVLHLLPFAALRDPSRPERYLIESKPLHRVSSATLYAHLRGDGGPRDTAAPVVGFGDPAYGTATGTASHASVRRALGRGLRLEPLPWSREELAALGRLAPGVAQLWTGADATEERAKSLPPRARVVHFACHGFLDEDSPLESGLALAIPGQWREGRENGLLQAWEVFEGVQLDADLVTLSACQTGLGKDLGGEGLLGLTWAFQYAGARSLVASLWEVSDASTAELMRRFYARLAAGLPKAEALRAAQVEMLRLPGTSAPYYWAGFQLIGAGR